MTMQPFSRAGIHSIAEYLPAEVASIGELHERGLLRGSPDTLRSFGFETVHLAGEESNIDMAIAAAEKVLEESESGSVAAQPFVDLLVEVRRELRAAKQFQIADSIRDRLKGLGVSLEDSPTGTTWRMG